MNAIISKLEFLKDEAGKFIYDECAIVKFYNKCKRDAERQNEKIKAKPGLLKWFSIIDPDAFATLQVNMYKHNFRTYKAVRIN